MDSLTQIVLGAAVGEAVLGKQVGNKALLYGALAGTIPDFDTFASHVTDTVSALEIHRGFTHSIIFSLFFAPIFGKLVSLYEKRASWKSWSWLFFWGFITHPLLDAHTTWGTQLFWPLDLRLAYKSIFVIDPLYTLPFLMFLILVLFQKRTSAKRRTYNRLGLWISSGYLALSLLLKGLAYQQFTEALQQQNISYAAIETRPAPFSTVLWSANIDAGDHYLIGHYSFFDTQPIRFTAYPKQHKLLAGFQQYDKVKRLIHITKGWYTVTEKNQQVYLNDLRFGLLSFKPDAEDFAFSFQLKEKAGDVEVVEVEKNRENATDLLQSLWNRIKGN